jgi:hypothetical protein
MPVVNVFKNCGGEAIKSAVKPPPLVAVSRF